MAFDSLGEYVAALRRAGELSEIRTRVSAHLEISEITDRVVKAGGPALLFTDVEGSPYPVLTNQFGSEKRMAMAFGARSLDELANRVRNAVVPNVPESTGARIAKLFSVGSAAFAIPRTVTDAPVQEVVEMGDDVDLTKLPVLTTWPLDGGPFFTLPLVFTKDPVSGTQNVGMYRMQRYDRNSTGMHWQKHKQGRAHAAKWGRKVPVAVVVGSDPAVTYAATAPLPPIVGIPTRPRRANGHVQNDRPQGSGRCGVRARGLRR
jgi:4-hydroxy-3-polyprenylbenzoate decarboxylase